MALEIWVLEADVVKGEHICLSFPPRPPPHGFGEMLTMSLKGENQKAITMSSRHCYRMALPRESSLSVLQLKNLEPWRGFG